MFSARRLRACDNIEIPALLQESGIRGIELMNGGQIGRQVLITSDCMNCASTQYEYR